MALARCVTSPSVFKLTSSAIVPAVGSRQCSRVLLRNFSPSRSRRLSSKRLLQTATVHRPQTLDNDSLLAPRNASVPDTSIAGGIPEINDTRPPKFTDQQSQQSQAETRSVGPTEAEAQKPKPAAAKATSAPEPTLNGPTPIAKPRSKLRPRRAAMMLTPAAIQQLRRLLSQPEPKLIRVGVKNRGCSGLSYNLEYVQKPGAFDETIEQDGVKVLIDSKALFSIIGSEMDWVEDKLNRRFIFRNPNIKEQCGCGESFMV
ncbi:MAG: Iron-sulfur assembly protein 1 [Trichoglossum hirsutum]|nr:MAG: Iron-sulfur assembly protein 1 [Trichoglossum hirsutum]